MDTPVINGRCAPGFEPVKAAFISNFSDRGEVGAALAVYVRGEPVVDLWGGVADAATGRTIGRQLAILTTRVAIANGALVLPADEMSRDHTACAEQPWSHGFYEGYDIAQGAPWHPAPEGHAAIAAALGNLLER